MNQLQVFKNNLFEVSAKVENDQILFDVEQVAKCLGFTEIKNNKVYTRWRTVNGYLRKYLSQDVAKGDLIPEPLVYKLAFKASNEIAEQFQDWLAIEVIPSIRKHGAYMTPITLEKTISDPDFLIGLLNNLKEEKNKRVQAEQERQQAIAQIKADQPYTNFGKIMSNSTGAISVGAFAKMMFDKHGLKIGRNKMFEWLRDNGYLIKNGRERNNPKQAYIQQGLFEVKPTIVSRTEGDIEKLTTLITGKGQIKLAQILLREFEEVI
ncbi:phage antirepressor KilAC domain-containing protein [Heyndrickxia ginsengihumi]|uniref:phage antirepressor KilAC domain-containing protein n=1 Tax=Heyndrickxia ginsengihumi TaxID=363870 RepID=UPI003D1BF9D3